MKLLAFETATEACSVAVWIDGAVRERFEVAPRRHAELALPWAEQLLAEAGIAKSQLDAIAVGRGPGAFTGVRLALALAQGIALALDRPVVPVSTLAALAILPPLRRQGARKADCEPLARGLTNAIELRSMAGRVGEGLCGLAADLPALTPPPPSLPLPSQGEGPRHVLAAIDARMGEVYSAAFVIDGDDVTALSPETVAKPDAVALPDASDGWFGIGTGFAAGDGALQRRLQAQLACVDATALPHAGDVARLASIAFARGEALAPEQVEPAYLRDNVALTLAEQQALRDSR